MEDLQDKIIELMDLFDDEQVTTADKIDRPERALEKQAIDDFMKRNPMAAGGMLVQPSADGSRPGYARVKTKTGNYGGSDFKPLTKENVKLLKTRYADEIKNTKGGYEKWRANPKNSWKVSAVRKGKITADTYKKPRLDLDALEKIIDRTNQENKIYSIKEISKIYFDEQNIKPKPGAVSKDDLRGSKAANPEVNKLFNKIIPPEEKVNRVIEQMLISDEPLPKITFKQKDANKFTNWRKYIINEVGQGAGDGLKKLLKNNKFYKKNAEVLNYMFNIRNDIEGMTFKDALDYATKAKKGMPRLSGMKGNFSFSPVYRTMDFAFRNWDANKGKGLVKFFDKNGKPITWSPGLKKLDYNTVSFSKGGKQTFSVNGKYNNSISIRADGEQFFPKVFEAVKTRNALLDTKVDDPFRKGKQILFSELINKIQVKGYGWSPDKKQVLEILHGPDGVAGNPFDNLKVGTSKLNNTLSTLDSIPIKGLKNKIMNQAYGQLKGLRGERLTKAIIDQQLEIGAKVAAGQTFPISDRTQILMDALDPEKEILGPLSQKEKTFIETKLKSPAVRLRNIETTEAIDNLLASFGDGDCPITFGKKVKAAADGGRIGYQTGTTGLSKCIESGVKNFQEGRFKTADQAQDAAKLLGGGQKVLRGLMKYGIVPEAAFVAGEAVFRNILGEKPLNALKKSIDTFTFGLTDFTSGIEAAKFGKDADLKLSVDKFRASQNKVNSIEQEIANLETLNTGSQFGYEGDQTEAIQMKKVELEAAKKELEQNYVNPDMVQYIDRKGENIADAQMAKSGYAKASLKDQMDGIPGVADYMDTETARVFPKQPSQVELNLNMLPSFQNYQKSDQGQIDRTIMNAPDEVLKEIAPGALEIKKALQEEYKMENLKNRFGAEQIYGTQGSFFGEPLAKGGRAGFKLGSLRKGIQALIDKSVKSTPKDTTPNLDALIKKTLDEDFFDKKDRIIDNINAKIARAKAKGLDSQEIGEGQIEFYDDITKSNFKTKTGPFFDYQKRKNKAGGGLLKQAGDRSGPPPESGPNPQGLQGLLNRVKKV